MQMDIKYGEYKYNCDVKMTEKQACYLSRNF